MAEPLGHKQPYVVGNRPLVITAQRTRTVAEPAQIRGDHAVPLGKGGYHMPPFPPGLRPAVQEDDRRSLASRHVVDQDLAQVGKMMTDVERAPHAGGAPCLAKPSLPHLLCPTRATLICHVVTTGARLEHANV